ncbi:hypothetical protein GGI04_000515, partial [Coemansia thaxteri]
MTANNATNSTCQAGMSSSGSNVDGNRGIAASNPGCADVRSAERSSTTFLPSAESAEWCSHRGLPAPFMTNPNYRIIHPAPGSASAGGRPSNFTQAAASASLPAWVSPTLQSKTYFPAASSIAERGSNGRALASDNVAHAPDSRRINASDMSDAMQVDDTQELRTEYDVLPYEIHTWSSHSANFLPHNILTDRPHDQASRWSTNANNHRQFITLRLERPALVRSITFGKFYKTHVCNLKEFKVFGGTTEDNMIELLYSGLRNDSENETISLKQRVHGHYIPCQYIKIQPLLAHDQKFNFSIWFVELRGTMDSQIMQHITADFSRLKEQEVVRSCLKFFRDRSFDSAFSVLQQQTSTSLETRLLCNIHTALVEQADYNQTEQLLAQAERDGMFASSAAKIPYAPVWRQVDQSEYAVPAARGGHQMCVDEENRTAYLFGGWDGANNLGDLWMLCLDSGKWMCVSTNTRNQGGPGPRSCHAMCFDSVHKCIYIMGKYVDHEYRGNTGLENDLFCYDTVNEEWLVLSENTEVLDGPMLAFNSQMVFDPLYSCLYVYGGKVVQPDITESRVVYCGLYRYDLRRHRWAKLKHDSHLLEQEHHIRGRYFHSMMIDSRLQRLYILSIKRDVSVPGDLLIYDIATNTFFEKMADLTANSPDKQPMTQQRYLAEQQRRNPANPSNMALPLIPPPDSVDLHPHHVHLVHDGRTIRTSLDADRQELYVLASSQNGSSSLASGPMMQSLVAMRGGRELPGGLIEQGSAGSIYTGAAYSHAMGVGFHPCSTLMDSGIRYEPGQAAVSGSDATTLERDDGLKERGQGPTSKSTGSSAQRRYEVPGEYIQMVLFCYHIPTETWTEVHNSARAAALFATNSSLCGSAKPAEQRVGSGKGIKYVETNDSVPPFPPSRYAQDWVFDKATRRHFMFGGNPNRPNDKSARFNDTWELQLSRPT